MGKKVKVDFTPASQELDFTPVETTQPEETPIAQEEQPSQPPTSKGFFGTLKDVYHSLKKSYETKATPEQEAKNKEQALDFVPVDVRNAFERGAASATQAEYLNPYGVDKTKAGEVAELQKKIESLPASKSYQDFTNAPSFGDAAKAFSKDPLKILTELTVESMTSLGSYGASRVAVGAALGGAAGSVVPGIGTAAGAGGGTIVGLADTSLALEFSSSILDSMKQAGVDVSDPKELQKAFENDALMDQARAHAYKKSIPIALFDLVSGGVAGKISSKPSRTLVSKLMKGTAEFGAQAGLGMAGERAGELTAGEELQPGNILAEGLGELGTTPVEVTAGVLSRKSNAPVSEKKIVIDKVINQAADTGSNEINAQIDAEALPQKKSPTVGEMLKQYEKETESLKQQDNAVQESSTSSVFQHPQETTGEPGGERQGVESSQQGQETSQKNVTQKEVTTQKEKVNQLLSESLVDGQYDFDKLAEARTAQVRLGEMQSELASIREEKAAHRKTVNVGTLLKEQIQAHYKNIETGVKKGRESVNNLLTKITDISKEHNLSGAQVNTLINKVKGTNMFTPGSVSKLNTFIEKVANDADYAEQLEQAETLRSRIKRSLKGSKSIEIKNLAKAFSRIDPSTVDKLPTYTGLAEDLVNHYKSPGNVEYTPVNARKVKDFTDQTLSAQLGDRIKQVRDEFGFGEEVSDSDIENYIYDEENENEDPFAKNRTEANNKIIHDKIRKIAEYSQLGLENADFQDKSRQPKIDMIAKMDLSKLDNSQLVDYIRTVDNMIENEDFSNTDKLEARAKAVDNAAKLRQLIKDTDLTSLGGVKKAVYGLPQMFKAAYRSSSLASEAYRLTGLADYFNSTSRKEAQERDQSEAFQKKFDELKKGDKNFDKKENQVDEQVFATLVRYPKGSDPTAALAKSKHNIEISISRLKEAGQEEIAKDAEKAYAKFKDASTVDEIFTIMKKENPTAFKMWEFWRDSFQNKIMDRLRRNAIEFHNNNFVEEENYTPKKLIYIDGTIAEEDANYVKQKSIGQSKQAVTAKTASNNLNNNQAINFNFYENMFRGFRESLHDIETARARQLVHEFMKLPESKQLLGGLDNKNAIIQNWEKNEEISRAYGRSYTQANALFNEAVNIVRTLSYTRALGGILQFPKQYASVALSTLGNLGSNAGLFFSAKIPKGADRLFNMYTIGQRGTRLGGLEKGESIHYQIQSAYAQGALKALGKVNKVTEQGAHAVLASLRKGDVSVAKRSWAAYYLQSLKQQGIDISKVDLAKEADLQNQESRQKAAAYAEQKVKETQLSSNPEEQGKLLKTKPGAETALKNLLIPFSSFSINTKIRLAEGLNRIRQEPGNLEAYRELGSTLAEIAAFNTIRFYVLQAGVNSLVKPLVEDMFNLKGEKKKEKEEDEFRFKQWYSEMVKEAFPTTVGTAGTAATVSVLNWLDWLYEHPKASFSDWQKQKKELVYNYHKDGIDLGLYSVGLEAVQNYIKDAKIAYDVMTNNKIYVSSDYGDQRVKLTKDQKEFILWNSLFDMMSATGFMDADFYNLVQKIKREQIKKGIKRAK